MKKFYITVLLLSSAYSRLTVNAQVQFQNLNFESATVASSPPENYPNPVSAASALPGWTALIGNVPQSQVQFNTDNLSQAAIDVFGPSWSFAGPGVIAGNYSVFLQSGLVPGGGGATANTSIEQIGTVPAESQSLQFKAWLQEGPGTFSVSFAGNTLALTALSSATAPNGQPYTVYGADVAPYDGQTGELEFTSLYNIHVPGLLLDDINFSTASVPEPSPGILITLGGFTITLFRKRLNRR